MIDYKRWKNCLSAAMQSDKEKNMIHYKEWKEINHRKLFVSRHGK